LTPEQVAVAEADVFLYKEHVRARLRAAVARGEQAQIVDDILSASIQGDTRAAAFVFADMLGFGDWEGYDEP
jgi:hypothetical protein